jgi:DNA-binding response OmpR family regulator
VSRILIVEDEQHLAQGLRFNLEAEGHDVSVTGDGETALHHLGAESQAYDAVILDVMLPGRDGFSVASELRRFRPHPDAHRPWPTGGRAPGIRGRCR